MREPDVLIAGAGPAGLATALALAGRGVVAHVLERRSGPLDKACGEGIMPIGVRALGALGVRADELGGAPFRGVRFFEGAHEFAGDFASGPGLGIRRTRLSAALRSAAVRAGITLEIECELLDWQERGGRLHARTSRGERSARWLVGADGLASRVRARAGLALPARSRRFGLRRHFRLAPWSAYVEVHFRDGAEAYVTPVAPDEVGIAVLHAADGRDYAALLGEFPQLAAKLSGVEPASSVRGAGPFWQGARRRHAGRVALVGDAAGYTDAVTGEGITLALRCADALAAALASGAPLEEYERAWRRLSRAHRAFARLLGLATDRPGLRHAAFAGLTRAPRLFESLLRRAAGES